MFWEDMNFEICTFKKDGKSLKFKNKSFAFSVFFYKRTLCSIIKITCNCMGKKNLNLETEYWDQLILPRLNR